MKNLKTMLSSKNKGGVVVMLIPARTDTKYFHDYIYYKAQIRFIKGRLKFGGEQKGSGSAPFPSMIVIFKKMKLQTYLRKMGFPSLAKMLDKPN